MRVAFVVLAIFAVLRRAQSDMMGCRNVGMNENSACGKAMKWIRDHGE